MKSYKIPLKHDARQIIDRAKEKVQQTGGHFDGDAASGTMAIFGVRGTYSISDQIAHITVTNKPFLLPWSMVDSKIYEFFS